GNSKVLSSRRGLLGLANNQNERRELSRGINWNRLNAIDSEFLSAAEVQAYCPVLDCRPNARHPVLGASLQRRGGIARHDAVAWGYARAADDRGVDIIQNCEVTGFRIEQGRILGVETSKGFIGAKKVGCVAAGHSSV